MKYSCEERNLFHSIQDVFENRDQSKLNQTLFNMSVEPEVQPEVDPEDQFVEK